MSSNNSLVIIRKKDFFELHENLCVDNDFKPDKDSFIKKDNNLIKLIKYAQSYMGLNYVEYGLSFNL